MESLLHSLGAERARHCQNRRLLVFWFIVCVMTMFTERCAICMDLSLLAPSPTNVEERLQCVVMEAQKWLEPHMTPLYR